MCYRVVYWVFCFAVPGVDDVDAPAEPSAARRSLRSAGQLVDGKRGDGSNKRFFVAVALIACCVSVFLFSAFARPFT